MLRDRMVGSPGIQILEDYGESTNSQHLSPDKLGQIETVRTMEYIAHSPFIYQLFYWPKTNLARLTLFARYHAVYCPESFHLPVL